MNLIQFFNFKSWASESFGIYHGDELIKVKLRFSKKVASRAAKITFHNSQVVSNGRNETLIVNLKCRGHRELIWELLQTDWLGNVIIEDPEQLRVEYVAYLEYAKLAF